LPGNSVARIAVSICIKFIRSSYRDDEAADSCRMRVRLRSTTIRADGDRLHAQEPSAFPRRITDDAAEVPGMEMRFLVGDDVCLHVAESGVRLVSDAVVESLDDVFLEVRRARMRVHHGFADCIR